MVEKHRFLCLATTGKFTLTELCAILRSSEERPQVAASVSSRRRDPFACAPPPYQFPELLVEAMIIAECRLHRKRGPKKLHKVLQVNHSLHARGVMELARNRLWNCEVVETRHLCDRPDGCSCLPYSDFSLLP